MFIKLELIIVIQIYFFMTEWEDLINNQNKCFQEKIYLNPNIIKFILKAIKSSNLTFDDTYDD